MDTQRLADALKYAGVDYSTRPIGSASYLWDEYRLKVAGILIKNRFKAPGAEKRLEYGASHREIIDAINEMRVK